MYKPELTHEEMGLIIKALTKYAETVGTYETASASVKLADKISYTKETK